MKVIRRWTNWELVSFGSCWYELHWLEGSSTDFSTEIIATDDTDAMRKAISIVAVDDRQNFHDQHL